MKFQCMLLLYLDDRRHLADIKRHCENFIEQLTEKIASKFPPVRFLLEIDVMDLLDVFPELGDFLLHEPLKLQRMCNEIMFGCLQLTNGDVNKTVQLAQGNTTIRLKSVPTIFKTNPRNYKGLVTFDGLLISLSKPESYVYHSVWSCPEECEGNEVILHYIPKSPPKCSICKSVLFENSRFRNCGERVTATFKLKDLISKNFMLVDDLIPKLKLGSRYVLHAVVMKKITSVWSLEEVLPLPSPITSPIPKDIAELYRVCKSVPWKFIYCLASSIGVNVCPLNCFMHLKISLLLSLASIKASMINGASPLHVLISGFDTRFVGQLMAEAAKLADRSVSLGTTNTVVSTAMIASSGGIFVMPLPLHIYNHKQTSAVLAAIETGEINTGTNQTKLKSAVWAQGSDFKKMILFNVASVFGNICRGDYGEYQDEIAEFDLQYTIEPSTTSDEEIKTLKEVKAYIDLVAGIEVTLEAEVENLLKNYFVAARREKPTGVPIGSMAALVANCLMSARLCRRTVANTDDAVFAIWLHVTGCPEPRLAPQEYLQTPADVKKLEKIINNFKDWLEQFICNKVF